MNENLKDLDKRFIKKIYDLVLKYMEDKEWIEFEYKPELAGRFDLISKIVYGTEDYYFIIPFFINQKDFWDMNFEIYTILLPNLEAISNAINEFETLKKSYGIEFWFD